MPSIGATGDCWEQFKSVLFSGIHASSNDEVQSSITDLSSTIVQSGVTIANAIFLEKNFKPKKEFVGKCESFYQSEVHQFSVSNPGDAAEAANEWVEKKTNGMINNLINKDQIAKQTVMILLNAIHFQAKWKMPFDKSNTKLQKFYGNPESSVQMMNQENVTVQGYVSNDSYSSVKLNYIDDIYSMIFIKPKDLSSLPLSISLIEDIYSELEPTKLIRLSIPRMTLECLLEASTTLKKLGMNNAFTAGGFENINPNVFISLVLHKAKIEIDEEGTKAAAATAVCTLSKSKTSKPVHQFILDTPFYYILMHNTTKAMLFMGQVSSL